MVSYWLKILPKLAAPGDKPPIDLKHGLQEKD
jgi:hypothetical protein